MTRDSRLRLWLTEPLTPDVRRAVDRLLFLRDVQRIAIMPDVHLAAKVCIGSVLATKRLVYPAAVGSDIGCGIATVAFCASGDRLQDSVERQNLLRSWLGAMRNAAPIMRHPSLAPSPALPEQLHPEKLSNPKLAAIARREGRIELGTLGRGNHFLELQQDDEGGFWLMVHSGSRVMGQAITEYHLARATRGRGGIDYLDTSTESGSAYLNDVAWAVQYASASRRLMLQMAASASAEMLGGSPRWDTFTDCNHNHVRSEEHDGEVLLVHRKGASPAAQGEPGLIPGCMGGESFHVVGRGEALSLNSSSHGAGRSMSRTEARKRISAADLRRQLEGIAFDEHSGHSLREEAPAAYKDIRSVMRAQRDLVRITRVVRGLASYKGL